METASSVLILCGVLKLTVLIHFLVFPCIDIQSGLSSSCEKCIEVHTDSTDCLPNTLTSFIEPSNVYVYMRDLASAYICPTALCSQKFTSRNMTYTCLSYHNMGLLILFLVLVTERPNRYNVVM